MRGVGVNDINRRKSLFVKLIFPIPMIRRTQTMLVRGTMAQPHPAATTKTRKIKETNAPSLLLNRDENELVFGILGRHDRVRKSMAPLKCRQKLTVFFCQSSVTSHWPQPLSSWFSRTLTLPNNGLNRAKEWHASSRIMSAAHSSFVSLILM